MGGDVNFRARGRRNIPTRTAPKNGETALGAIKVPCRYISPATGFGPEGAQQASRQAFRSALLLFWKEESADRPMENVGPVLTSLSDASAPGKGARFPRRGALRAARQAEGLPPIYGPAARENYQS